MSRIDRTISISIQMDAKIRDLALKLNVPKNDLIVRFLQQGINSFEKESNVIQLSETCK